MPCIEQRIPGGVAIYCTRGRPTRRASCYACKAPHEALCDWPVGDGKTCYRKLCREHRAWQGGDVDYCPEHAVLAAKAVR
jgi:hypothetical protein